MSFNPNIVLASVEAKIDALIDRNAITREEMFGELVHLLEHIRQSTSPAAPALPRIDFDKTYTLHPPPRQPSNIGTALDTVEVSFDGAEGEGRVWLCQLPKHEFDEEPWIAIEGIANAIELARLLTAWANGYNGPAVPTKRHPESIHTVAPEDNSYWDHTNGNRYKVALITNRESDKPEYRPTVVYLNVANGKWYSRPVSDWHRSMTRVAE